MIEEVIERTARELRNEADIDFIDLPFIAANLREDLDLRTQDEIRRHMLDVVRRLMERGVYPGDFTLDDLGGGADHRGRHLPHANPPIHDRQPDLPARQAQHAAHP